MPTTTVRDLCSAAWEATVRSAEAGTRAITPSAFAGMTLAMTGGDAGRARWLIMQAAMVFDMVEREEVGPCR